MEENNLNKIKISIIISSVLLVVALVVGVSYAYFSSISTSATKTVTTGKLSLTFDDSTAIINASNISPIARESILTKAVKKEFTITNTYVPQTISIPVTKKWANDSNYTNARPSSVTVKLLANGSDTGKTITLSSPNWTGQFTNINKYCILYIESRL